VTGPTGVDMRLSALLRFDGDVLGMIDCGLDDPSRGELEDIAAAIAGERAPLLGRADVLGQARTIEALYRAAAEGRSVAL
jgi:predicted dehydrogenase